MYKKSTLEGNDSFNYKLAAPNFLILVFGGILCFMSMFCFMINAIGEPKIRLNEISLQKEDYFVEFKHEVLDEDYPLQNLQLIIMDGMKDKVHGFSLGIRGVVDLNGKVIKKGQEYTFVGNPGGLENSIAPFGSSEGNTIYKITKKIMPITALVPGSPESISIHHP